MEGITTHAITPQKDTAYTVTGLKADLLDPRDYPVEAVCLECGRPVRRNKYMFAEWFHFQREDESA